MRWKEQIDLIGSVKMEPGEPNSDTEIESNDADDADDALINQISFWGHNPHPIETFQSQLGPISRIFHDFFSRFVSIFSHFKTFFDITWNFWNLKTFTGMN